MICLKCVFQCAVACEQVVQVAIQESVVPQEVGHIGQVSPDLVDARFAILLEAQAPFDLLLELRKNTVDDVVFVAEMVIKIAWANLHFLGDGGGRDVGFAELVDSLSDSSRMRSRVRRGGFASIEIAGCAQGGEPRIVIIWEKEF